MELPGKSLTRYALLFFSAILLAVAIVYLVERSLLERHPDIDFRFIWTAGKVWAMGVDPYSPRYTVLGHQLFPVGNPVEYWLYPPQWWVISRPLAAFSVEPALVIWRTLNALILVVAAAALALVVQRARPAMPLCAILGFIALVALMEGTAQTLLLGQTSILVFAGFCALGCALLTGRPLPMVIALVLLMLKPQFAVPILIWFALTKRWRMSVLIAVVITSVASLPQIVQFGLLATVKGMLGVVAFHAQMNTPDVMIGFSHLIWQMTAMDIPNAADIVLDILATLIFGVLISRHPGPDDRDQAALGIGLIASAMFFLPLHTYDTVALGPIAMLAVLLRGAPRYLAWASVALALRPGVIGEQFIDRTAADRMLLSLAGLLALIAAASAVWSFLRTRGPDGAEFLPADGSSRR